MTIEAMEMTDRAIEMFGEGVVEAGDDSITLRIGSWDDSVSEKVFTIDDVIEYFAAESRNMMSGCRTIGGVSGDWREVDNIAQSVLEWFKVANVEKLRETVRERDMTPKF